MNSKHDMMEKEFDTVKFFREVKEKIAKETKDMTFAEFKARLNRRKLRLDRSPSAH
jgi:rubrerythrin